MSHKIKTERFHKKRLFLISIAVISMITGWYLYMRQTDQLSLFTNNYFISLMMVFASFIAGSTAEGGGAVAFPIMTLFFKIPPSTSRDFALMIQSFGMSFASLTILIFKIDYAKKALLLAVPASCLGVIIGFIFLEGVIPPKYLKVFFTSFWLIFCYTLIKYKVLNSQNIKKIFHNQRKKK